MPRTYQFLASALPPTAAATVAERRVGFGPNFCLTRCSKYVRSLPSNGRLFGYACKAQRRRVIIPVFFFPESQPCAQLGQCQLRLDAKEFPHRPLCLALQSKPDQAHCENSKWPSIARVLIQRLFGCSYGFFVAPLFVVCEAQACCDEPSPGVARTQSVRT